MEQCSKIYTKDYSRIQHTLFEKTSHNKNFRRTSSKFYDQRNPRNDNRNKENDFVQGNSYQSPEKRILVQNVSSKETRWVQSADLQLEETKHICSDPEVSPFESHENTIFNRQTRSYDEDRSVTGIFSRPCEKQSLQISHVGLPGAYLRDDLLALRPSECTGSLCKVNELGGTSTAFAGNQNCGLSRRFSSHSRKPRHIGEASSFCQRISEETGLVDKSSEIFQQTHNRAGIFGHCLGHREEQETPRQKESRTSYFRHKILTECATLELAGCQDHTGQTELRVICRPSRQIALPDSAKRIESAFEREQTQEDANITDGASRTRLVAQKQQPENPNTYSRPCSFYNNRRFRSGLGCGSQWTKTMGHMDDQTKILAQQPEGTMDVVRGPEAVEVVPEKEISYVANRQSNECSIYNKARGYKIVAAPENDNYDFRTLPNNEMPANCSLYSGNLQRSGRSPFQAKINARVASQAGDSFVDFSTIRHAPNRLVRVEKISNSAMLCERGCEGHEQPIYGRIQQEVGLPTRLDLSPPPHSFHEYYDT